MISLRGGPAALCNWSQFKVVYTVPGAVFCPPFPRHREAQACTVELRSSSDVGKDRPEAGHTLGHVTVRGSGIPPAPKDKGIYFRIQEVVGKA